MIDRQGALTEGAIANPHQRALDGIDVLGLGQPFRDWIQANWHIWDRFLKLSDQMRLKGRKYYAARTVIEVMRWHYHLQDTTDKAFIHNNNWTPKMARLYNHLTGTDFFQTRENSGHVPIDQGDSP